MLDPTLSHERRVEAAGNAADFYEYCADFIAARRENLGDDMVSRLISARDDGGEGAPALTEPELVSVFSQLLVGGNETTRNFLGNMFLRLLEHPDQLEAVRSDPGLAGAAVEESLRHSSPTKGLYRRTTEDVEIGDVTIPEGRLVVVMWASANRDETVFDDPDRYDIRRSNADKHQAFSRHAHFCAGAPLARLEGRLSLERVLARLPNLRRADEKPLSWQPIPLHQGLERLDLAWDPA
jgi:cytochrome P450